VRSKVPKGLLGVDYCRPGAAGTAARQDDGATGAAPAQAARARRLLFERPGQTYTRTDYVSFAIMRRLAVIEVIATDDHFRQEGVTVLPYYAARRNAP
jgi:hypothetical protein